MQNNYFCLERLDITISILLLLYSASDATSCHSNVPSTGNSTPPLASAPCPSPPPPHLVLPLLLLLRVGPIELELVGDGELAAHVGAGARHLKVQVAVQAVKVGDATQGLGFVLLIPETRVGVERVYLGLEGLRGARCRES